MFSGRKRLRIPRARPATPDDHLVNLRATQHYADALLRDPAPYPVVWATTGTQPSLGSGTLGGYVTDYGPRAHILIFLEPADDTAYGTGAFTFTLPYFSHPLFHQSVHGGVSSHTLSHCGPLSGDIPQNSATIVRVGVGTGGLVTGGTAYAALATGDALVLQGFYFPHPQGTAPTPF